MKRTCENCWFFEKMWRFGRFVDFCVFHHVEINNLDETCDRWRPDEEDDEDGD